MSTSVPLNGSVTCSINSCKARKQRAIQNRAASSKLSHQRRRRSLRLRQRRSTVDKDNKQDSSPVKIKGYNPDPEQVKLFRRLIRESEQNERERKALERAKLPPYQM